VSPKRSSRRSVIGIALISSGIIACADSGSEPIDDSPLAGLTRVTTNDSSTAPPPSTPTPGYFRGTVRGYSTTSGPDTLATAVRLPNVRVTAYPRIESRTDTLGTGPAAGSVLTDANGEFTMPTMPGGEYIVTFNPQAPEDSQYRGGWTVTTVHERSQESPWFIMLPKKEN
jgi:hypothetical protein